MSNCTLCKLGTCIQPERVIRNRVIPEHPNKSNRLPGRGKVPCDLMLIGEAPGETEDEQFRVFCGTAGQKLSECIVKAGLFEEGLFITNVVRCRPPNNRDPEPDEVEACLPYLLQEIESVNPKVIVLMGNVPLKLLGAGLRTVTRERGEVYEFQGRTAVIAYHPSYVNRKKEEEDVFISDLKLAKGLASGESRIEEEVDYRVVRDMTSLRALRDRLCQAKKFSFDIEAQGFDHIEDKLLCIGFCDAPKTGFTVPLRGQHLSQIWDDEQWPEVIECLREIFESDAVKIASNGKFDCKFIRRQLGIRVNNYSSDPTITHHLIDETLPNTVEFQAGYYLGLPRHDKELKSYLPNEKTKWDVVPNKVMWKYNCGDVDREFRLAEFFEPMENKPMLEKVCIPLAHTLTEMELCGVWIDQEQMARNSDRYKTLIAQTAQEIFEVVGHEFKLGSPQQLGKVLFNPPSEGGLGLPNVGTTEAGNFQTGKDLLAELAGKLRSEGRTPEEKLAILDKIVYYRRLKHWKGTFIDGTNDNAGLKRWIHSDGRIYPTYNQTGTDMGRCACREPNLQNIPRDQALRNQFASPPGWYYVHADYSQAEARTGAVVSNCKGLLETMAKGLNIHRNAASILNHVPYDEVTRHQYEVVKFVTHGLHYGRGIPSIAEEYGLPHAEVQEFVTKYFTQYPELSQLMLSQVDKVVAGEPIVNVFGRRRHFKGKITGHEKRVAISFAFASNWADSQNLATIRLYERFVKEGIWFDKVKMNMTLHDALFFEVREDVIAPVVDMIIEEMEAPVPELGNYRFPIELEAGRCWEDPEQVVLWKGK